MATTKRPAHPPMSTGREGDRQQARDPNEQRLRMALREAGGGAWDWDLIGDEAWWSPEMFELLGARPDMKVTLESALALVHEQDRYRVRNSIQEALAQKGKYRVEFRIEHPVRGQRWMASRGRLVYDSVGRPIRLRGITLDVTARRNAEEEVRKSEERLRAILDTAADAIVTISQRGVIVEVNPATEKMFGYTRDELMGRNVGMLMPPPYGEERSFLSRQPEAGGAGMIGAGREVEGRKKDGTVFPVELAVSRRDHLGFLTGIMRDVSDRKKSERELENHRHALRAMSSELMLTEERERRQLAQDLHDSLGQALFLAGRKLSGLSQEDDAIREVRNILDSAARSVNALTFELSPPILHDLGLRPAIRWLGRDMQKRYGLSVDIDDDGKPFRIEDRVAMIVWRCVRELLVNAAKHAQTDAGAVRVRTGRSLSVTVEDHGCGFDPAIQCRQVEAGHFGLFSVRERLEYVGGTLDIRSAPGKGTSVSLTVPLTAVGTAKSA